MQKLAKDLVKNDRLIFRGEVVVVTGRKALWNKRTGDYTVTCRYTTGTKAMIYIGLNGTIDLVV
jgi:GH15 family glucan-1,4-alpha-glucosidase